MRPLSEWDSDYLDELAHPHQDETANFEKKASDKFALDSKGKVTAETKQELAKQVCAFANSGDGVIVYGLKNDGGIDAGISGFVGRQPVKDWAEALIPKLHQKPIQGCEGRFIQHHSHAPGKGVLVIAVPLSEYRPHWTQDEEKAYLRVGAHSAPMRPQTLLDMNSRGLSQRGNVLDLGLYSKPGGWPEGSGNFAFLIRPEICLESGTVCELWGLELQVTRGSGQFKNEVHKDLGLVNAVLVTVTWNHTLYFRGREPLFPRRSCHAMPFENEAWICVPPDAKEIGITATLFLASGQPFVKEFLYEVRDGNLAIVSG